MYANKVIVGGGSMCGGLDGHERGIASAGESTGNGKTTPIGAAPDNSPHASSICSFSGQNPERFLDPADPDFEPGRTQSWGQILKDVRAFLVTIGESPGQACNGHTGAFAGGE